MKTAALHLSSIARYPKSGGGEWGTPQTLGCLAHAPWNRDEISRYLEVLKADIQRDHEVFLCIISMSFREILHPLLSILLDTFLEYSRYIMESK